MTDYKIEFTGRATIRLHHGDCMEALPGMKENQYELAIVDPPYGIGILSQFKGCDMGKSMFAQTKATDHSDWDSCKPTREYFIELLKVSCNQIIWGGNYFIDHLRSTRCMVSWDKMNGTNNMSDFEIAWTSFDKACRRFSMHHFSAGYGKKIHICQKPVALYKWLLANYAKDGDRILDTHGGSMSIAIACWDLGFDLDLWELDADYFAAGVDRLRRHISQGQFDL